MIIVYTVFALGILWVSGYLMTVIMGCNEFELFKKNNMLFAVFGTIVLISILMILGLVLPINVVSVVICVGLFLLVVVYRQELLLQFRKFCEKGEYVTLFVTFVISAMTGISQILKDELYLIVMNNDFGYYIASIDWLKCHSILQPVEYSLDHPLYSMAEYMLDYTRIGMDVLGAFLANIFKLEAHEIFAVLCSMATVLIFYVVYTVIYYYTDNKVVAVSFGFFSAVNGNIVTLMGKQYIPQLLGIVMLILAFCMLDIFFKEPNKKNTFLCSIALSGVLAIYCEFGVYIFCFVVAYTVIYIFRKKEKLLIRIIVLCLETAVINPYGIYKAVKFNLSIFMRVSEQGAQNIDPYGGNMLSVKKILGCLVGFSDSLVSKNEYYMLGCLMGISLVIISVVVLLYLQHNKCYEFIWVTCGIFFLLEVYFRMSKGAYQEYKHITSASVVCIMCIGCIVGGMIQRYGRLKKVQYIFASIIMITAVYSFGFPMKQYCSNELSVDSKTMELGEAAEFLVPQTAEIEIDSSINVPDYMSAVYALKNHSLNLNADSPSYLQYFQQFQNDDPSEYILYEKNKQKELDEDNDIVWSNEKYVLVRRKNMEQYQVLDMISGGFFAQTKNFTSKVADYVVNQSGQEGFVIYGPYLHLQKGPYKIILDYTIEKMQTTSGYFDIIQNGNIIYSQRLEDLVGNHRLIIEKQSLDTCDDAEFRVYADNGATIKVEKIKYRRL